MKRLTPAKLALKRRWLARGESVIASIGLALAAILISVMVASTWLTMRSQRELQQSAELSEIQSNGALIAQAAEAMLSAHDLSAVRRLIVNAARDRGWAKCRVILTDGQVLADADVTQITAKKLPQTWSVQQTNEENHIDNNLISLKLPLDIAGRGKGLLEIAASPPSPSTSLTLQSGMALIGVAGLLAMLIVYRRMRARLGPMAAICDALLAKAQGEKCLDALQTRAVDGPESQSWNAMLAEMASLRSRLLENEVLESASSRLEAGIELASVCDAMWHGVVVVDDKLQIKYVNGAAAVLLRGPHEEMNGRFVTDFIRAPEVMESVQAVITGSLRRKSTVEIKEQADSGLVILRFGIRPVRRGDAAAAMVIIEDLTQQRLAEEARNSFVTQATHELRMPLTNIRLYAENAVEVGDGDPAARANCLNVINQESRRLERIVGDMLSVAEIEAGTLKIRHGEVRLQALFDELRADYEALAKEKSVTLQFLLPPKLGVIKGDRDKIVLAMHNLIGNAIKYTPANGSVTVTVEVENGVLNVEVSDTGIGIRETETDLIFEKFYRSTDPRVAGIAGSGLGLALAREVIRLHRGDITLRSQVDKGSTFTLSIPSCAEAA